MKENIFAPVRPEPRLTHEEVLNKGREERKTAKGRARWDHFVSGYSSSSSFAGNDYSITGSSRVYGRKSLEAWDGSH